MTEAGPASAMREYASERVAFFSDGVFAIAATLLVLDVRVPAGTTSNHLGRAVRDLRPEMFAYCLSFAVIASFWLSHHRLYDALRAVDSRLLEWNLLLLGLVAAIPFPTNLVGRYGESSVAVASYASVLGLAGLVGTYLWWHARRHHLFAADVPDRVVVHSVLRGVSMAAVFLLSVPIAIFSPDAAKLAWLAIIVLRLGLRRRFGPVYRLP